MLNLNELEAMWLRYKIKSYIPHIIILFSTLVIISIVLSIDFNNENEKNVTKKSSTINTATKKNENGFINKSIKKEEVITKKTLTSYNDDNNNKMIMSPNLDFIKSMNKNSPMYYDSQDTNINYTHKNKNIYKIASKKEKTVKKPELIIEVDEVETEIVKENTIDIKRQTTEDDLQQVIKRFKKSNNPALSLFIAKKYYELENYNQSYNYALITNEMNNNIEDSWIIFAKSLVKLNKKQKSIDVLKKYINHSNSSRAQQLLNNIKSGKMK